jgi:hypothetical protein
MKCKQELETNMSTAHAVLWEQCAWAMQNEIQNRLREQYQE